MKINKKNKKRLFWIFGLPLIIFVLILYPHYIDIQRSSGTDDWEYRWDVYEKGPTFFTAPQKLFENTFEISWYKFCFQNNNKYFLTLNLLINNAWKDINMPPNAFYCETINLKNGFMYSWVRNEPGGINLDNLKKWNPFPPFPFPILLTKLFFVFLIYLPVLWLVTRIIYFYRYGITK